MTRLSLLLCLLFCCVAPAFGLEWAKNIEEAKARAAAEGKLVLALFYGSEFTRNFANMREEVFDSAAFCAYAEEKFVPVEMYEPKDRAQHADFIWKYRALCREYDVKQWPTALIMTPEGIPTGGLVGGQRYEMLIRGELYCACTREERLNVVCTAFDNALVVAERLREVNAMPEGADRLRALAATYYRVPENLAPRIVFAGYVAAHDPENQTGLRDEYLNMREMVEWGELGRYGMDSATTLRRMQEMIDKARPANLLTMLQQRFNTQSHHLDSPEDIRAFTLAMEALAAELEKTAPEEAAALRREHAELYGDSPEEGFQRLQERREVARQEQERRKKEAEAAKEAARKARWRKGPRGPLLR